VGGRRVCIRENDIFWRRVPGGDGKVEASGMTTRRKVIPLQV